MFRYSSLKDYIIYDIQARKSFLLTKSGSPQSTRYAKWSPVGHSVLFVRDNNVFVNVNLTDERQITFDGSATVFNGVPDWIYEEEVYEQDFTCWWSPDAKKIAFLRLDETQVPLYSVALFEAPGLPISAYPSALTIKYPKPGYPNPIATIHVYDLSSVAPSAKSPVPTIKFSPAKDFTDDDRLLVEVAWLGNDNLMVRAMNRVQDIARLWLIDSRVGMASMECSVSACDRLYDESC